MTVILVIWNESSEKSQKHEKGTKVSSIRFNVAFLKANPVSNSLTSFSDLTSDYLFINHKWEKEYR